MQVRYVDSSHKKFGTIEHVNNQLGLTLIALGTCEEIKPPKRGAPGWIEWRTEQSRINFTGPYSGILGSDVVAPFVAGIEWSVRDENGVLFVVRASGSESIRFTEAPVECPENVRKEFLEMSRNRAAQAEASVQEYARVLNGAR